MKSVLVTGASGLIGSQLCKVLYDNNITVKALSRNPTQNKYYTSYKWDIKNNFIDENAFKDIDAIIHLAGENIGEGRWTKRKKQKIIDSRINSTSLLFENYKKHNPNLQVFITASAVGYYESFYEKSPLIHEKSLPGKDFASRVCVLWEKEADKFEMEGIRTVKVRTALVQDIKDPALKKIMLSAKFGIIPVLGKGLQPYPWIHIHDLINIYLFALNNENILGAINANAPELITHLQYIQELRKIKYKNRPVIHIPLFVLKILFGEKTDILCKGTKISSILHDNRDFIYKFPKVSQCLESIIR